tara:strand:+ start:77 stop:226 length:150 start_codon:yes stop_codon:yes gene_type:complete
MKTKSGKHGKAHDKKALARKLKHNKLIKKEKDAKKEAEGEKFKYKKTKQ